MTDDQYQEASNKIAAQRSVHRSALQRLDVEQSKIDKRRTETIKTQGHYG